MRGVGRLRVAAPHCVRVLRRFLRRFFVTDFGARCGSLKHRVTIRLEAK
jgi:hypothetical protein